MRMRHTCWNVGQLAALAAALVVGTWSAQSRADGVERSTARAEDQGLIRGANQGEERCKASSLIGMKVHGLNGDEKLGSINDLVLSQDGRIKYVAVSFGGVLGMGDKLFAVPFESIDFVKTDKEAYARIGITAEVLREKQGFNKDTWPAEADHSFAVGNLRQQASTPAASR